MRFSMFTIAVVSAITGLSPDASAQRRHRTPAPGAYDGSAYSAAALNRALTERAQHEPGLATELFPDFRQTATGGPSGGFPNGGF